MTSENEVIPDDLDARDLRLVLRLERGLTKMKEGIREEMAKAMDEMAETMKESLLPIKERVAEIEDNKKQTRMALVGAGLGLASSLIMWLLSWFKGQQP